MQSCGGVDLYFFPTQSKSKTETHTEQVQTSKALDSSAEIHDKIKETEWGFTWQKNWSEWAAMAAPSPSPMIQDGDLPVELQPVQDDVLDRLNQSLNELHKHLKAGLTVLEHGQRLAQKTSLQQGILDGLEKQLEAGEDFAAKLGMSIKFKKSTWDSKPWNQLNCKLMADKSESMVAELFEHLKAARVLIPAPPK